MFIPFEINTLKHELIKDTRHRPSQQMKFLKVVIIRNTILSHFYKQSNGSETYEYILHH